MRWKLVVGSARTAIVADRRHYRGKEPNGLRREFVLADDDAAMEMIKRLGALFAVRQKSSLQGGVYVEFNDPEIGACVQYIITDEPSVDACPGFSSSR